MENLEVNKQIEMLKQIKRKITQLDLKLQDNNSISVTKETPKVKKIGTIEDERRRRIFKTADTK